MIRTVKNYSIVPAVAKDENVLNYFIKLPRYWVELEISVKCWSVEIRIYETGKYEVYKRS